MAARQHSPYSSGKQRFQAVGKRARIKMTEEDHFSHSQAETIAYDLKMLWKE